MINILSDYGILLGNYSLNDELQITNSFELVIEDYEVDLHYLSTRLSQHITIYPNEFIIGVYQISQSTIGINEKLFSALKQQYNSLIKLTFDPLEISKQFIDLNKYIKVYKDDYELQVIVQNEESSNIAIETILNVKDKEDYTNQNKLKDEIESKEVFLSSLHDKINLIITYLKNFNHEDDEISDTHYQILRNISSLVSKLNYKQSNDIKEELIRLENDYNTLLTIGIINDNLTNLELINKDFKKLDNIGF